MPIDYHRLKAWAFPDVVQTYTERTAMAYALSLGVGRDPTDAEQLPFVYEGLHGGLRLLPTLPVVLGYPGFWMRDPATGIDWKALVHGENGLTLHAPLPAAGTVRGRSRVTAIVDKGAGKGAVVTVERRIENAESGELYATIRHVTVCRGDGGYSAGGQPSDTVPARETPRLDGRPDAVHTHETRPEMALAYRLLADPNPLHADPAIAAAAGFARPILHGLASYGVAAWAIVQTCCDGIPSRMKSIDVRFSAPVYPGETLRTDMWRDSSGVSFRMTVVERDQIVLNHGRAELAC